MTILRETKKIAVSIVDKVSPSCGRTLRSLSRQLADSEDMQRRLDQVENELHEMRKLIDILNHDLDESRRLNLRAAELMDITFSQLAK